MTSKKAQDGHGMTTFSRSEKESQRNGRSLLLPSMLPSMLLLVVAAAGLGACARAGLTEEIPDALPDDAARPDAQLSEMLLPECKAIGNKPNDWDGDGLPDTEEVENYGTNPCDPDTDGDDLEDGRDTEPLGSGEAPSCQLAADPAPVYLAPGQKILRLPFSVPARIGNAWHYSSEAVPLANESLQQHRAIDYLVGHGTPILAACDGRAISDIAGSIDSLAKSYGKIVILRCNQQVVDSAGKSHSLFVLYAHLQAQVPATGSRLTFHSEPTVGSEVTAGRQIGLSGSSGTIWPHLHFQVYLDDYDSRYTKAVDPYDILARTTGFRCSGARYYPGSLSPCLFTSCGPAALFETCPPKAKCEDTSCDRNATSPGAYAPAHSYYDGRCDARCPLDHEMCETIAIESPDLLGPVDGTVVDQGATIDFSWSAAEGANRYRVAICGDETLATQCDRVVENLPAMQKTYSTSDLPPGKWYWAAAGIGTDETKGWGPYAADPWSVEVCVGACGGCTDECSPEGKTECVGETSQKTCGNTDEDECLEWLAPAICAAGGKCTEDRCSTCVDDCVNGQKECVGDSSIRACGNNDGDACTDWLPATPCSSGYCSGGQCATCTNDCAPEGKVECIGTTSSRTCGKHDADPCLDWSAPTPCPGGNLCSDNSCACRDDCTEKGKTECLNSSTFHTCGESDTDSCLDWSTPSYCPVGSLCDTATGECSCKDECTPDGSTRCNPYSALVQQTCGASYDTDKCLEWGNNVTCTFKCSSGQCCGTVGKSCCADSTPKCNTGLVCKAATSICETAPMTQKVYRFKNQCSGQHWHSTTSACYPSPTDPKVDCSCTSQAFNPGCSDVTCWQYEFGGFSSYKTDPGFGSYSELSHCLVSGGHQYSKTGCATAGVPASLGWISNESTGAWTTPLYLCQVVVGSVTEHVLSLARTDCTGTLKGTIVQPEPFGYVMP
ncbi:MAG: M23 family metallopeptidase [Pseudomonadota bacterium]